MTAFPVATATLRSRDARQRRARPLLGLAAALVLAACSSQPGPPKADQGAVRDFSARGYTAAVHTAASTQRENWLVTGQTVPVVLTLPAGAGPQPLVVYLPGIGEHADAGERWRSAWAAAGYVVLSVQPLADDANAWQSDLARGGEFRELGRQRFGAQPMAERLALLGDVLAEARRRGAGGEPALQRIDWTRAALAGYDLGATTAITAAGAANTAAGAPAWRAVLALSPSPLSATPARTPGPADARASGITLPVLTVTGDGDGDLLGLLDTPALRRLPFEQMSGPDKFLLRLQGLAHPGFGGDLSLPAQRANAIDAPPRAEPADSGTVPPTQRRGQRNTRAGGPDQRPLAGRRPEDSTLRPTMSPTAMELRGVAAQAVTTAFFDAMVKGDARARAWLGNAATDWLGDLGELQRK